MTNNNSPYQLPVVETISTSWDKVSGSKGSIWAALGIFILVMLGLGFVQGIFQSISPALGQLVGLAFTFIELLLQMGLIYIGITRAFDKPITYRLMFSTFNTSLGLKIIGLYLLKFLIVLVPIALIFAGTLLAQSEQGPAVVGSILGLVGLAAMIYLSIRLYVATAFVIDQNVGPIAAIKQSFHATRHNVIPLLGLTILQMLIYIIAIIPLGIGLIWVIPLGLIIYGTVYKRLSSH